MPIEDLAEMLAKLILQPMENPSEQDLSFRKQAEQVGVDPKRFTFEVIAIQNFAMGQAVNRERLEGRMTTETAKALAEHILRAIDCRLHETTSYDLLQLGLDPEQTLELIMKRHDRYIQPAWGKGSPEDIRKFFAEFCGFPTSEVLERIGWSLSQVRGDAWGEFLRRNVKVIPSSSAVHAS